MHLCGRRRSMSRRADAHECSAQTSGFLTNAARTASQRTSRQWPEHRWSTGRHQGSWCCLPTDHRCRACSRARESRRDRTLRRLHRQCLIPASPMASPDLANSRLLSPHFRRSTHLCPPSVSSRSQPPSSCTTHLPILYPRSHTTAGIDPGSTPRSEPGFGTRHGRAGLDCTWAVLRVKTSTDESGNYLC